MSLHKTWMLLSNVYIHCSDIHKHVHHTNRYTYIFKKKELFLSLSYIYSHSYILKGEMFLTHKHTNSSACIFKDGTPVEFYTKDNTHIQKRNTNIFEKKDDIYINIQRNCSL